MTTSHFGHFNEAFGCYLTVLVETGDLVLQSLLYLYNLVIELLLYVVLYVAGDHVGVSKVVYADVNAMVPHYKSTELKCVLVLLSHAVFGAVFVFALAQLVFELHKFHILKGPVKDLGK